jgi:hypothetical protein
LSIGRKSGELCLLSESLQFGKIWGKISSLFCFDQNVSFLLHNQGKYVSYAIKLILIFCQNFIFQSGTTTILSIQHKSQDFFLHIRHKSQDFCLHIRHKSQDFCLFGESLKTFVYSAWVSRLLPIWWKSKALSYWDNVLCSMNQPKVDSPTLFDFAKELGSHLATNSDC